MPHARVTARGRLSDWSEMAAKQTGRLGILFGGLERAAILTVLAAAVATLLLVARSNLVPSQRPWTFGLVFGAGFLLLYGALILLPAAALVLVLAWRRMGRTVQLLSSLGAATFLAIVTWVDWRAARSVFLLSGPDRFRLAAQAAFVLAMLGLALLAVTPVLGRRARSATRLVALAAFALTVWALWPLPRPAANGRPAAAAPPGAVPSQRFLLIALDAADWRYVDPLLERGELPNLAALKARGAHGPLKTAQPTLSPIVWTSVATGVPPGRHGIDDFFAERLGGVSGRVPRIKPPRRLGFGLLEAELKRRQIWAKGQIGSDARRVPAYWNIAAAHGLPLLMVNWWVTWPAEPIVGSVVTDRFYFDRLVRKDGPPATRDLTYPEALFDEVKSLAVLPADLPIETARTYFDVTPEEYERMRRRDDSLQPALLREFTYFVGSFETDRRVALHLLGRPHDGPVAPDALVLFRLVDKMCHGALGYSELVAEHPDARPADVTRFARAVTQAYRDADRAIGELIEAFGAGNVIVVSDHGFQLERHDGIRYSHDLAPDGVFLAAGPAFKAGRVDGLTIYDVLPLLLYLKGLPTADDQPGRVPREALTADVLASQVERRIATYGTREPGRLAEGDQAIDEEVLARLRELGYIPY